MEIKEMIESLIEKACLEKVTDIHFKPTNNQVQVYYRTNNELKIEQEITNVEFKKIINYLKFKTNLDISITNSPQDGAMEIKIREMTVNIRLSFVPLLYGESLVIRIILPQLIIDEKSLFFNYSEYETILKTIVDEVGLFVFTGPTGCGKTTTMYKLLNDISIHKNLKIITVENPIEIKNENFVQMQVDQNKKFTYKKALKSILRQDPDIIMIGEIRDYETAKIVMQAALTGHMIITTMHTKDKRGVFERFIDFGFKPSEINSVLIGVCNQRLTMIENQKKVFLDIAIKEQLQKLNESNQEIFIKDQIEKFINR